MLFGLLREFIVFSYFWFLIFGFIPRIYCFFVFLVSHLILLPPVVRGPGRSRNCLARLPSGTQEKPLVRFRECAAVQGLASARRPLDLVFETRWSVQKLRPKRPRVPLTGPRGPLKGPRGHFKGPRGPFKGPRGPFKGDPGSF